MGLRAYQMKARQDIHKGFEDFDRQLGVLPTGAGKTILFSRLAQDYQPRRTLILAHREELITQAVDKLRVSTGIEAQVEMGEDRAALDAPVVVASVQTLMREKRRERWPRDHFGLVVVDEAHHALADSYLNTLGHFHDHAKVLGVSATPDRGDKKNLGRYFENIACEVTLLDLINLGWLSPIQVKTVPLGMDLRGVRTSHGDFSADDLGHALEPYLEQIADVLVEHRHRKTLVFLPLIAVSKRFAQICRDRGLLAEHVDGQTTERQATLGRFKRDETRILCNAMLLTEGYDEPSIDCVVCLRPTKIRALYSQIIGRGTRIWPGKDHLLVLDFLWQAEEHTLMRPANLIAEDEADAKALTEKLGAEGDLEEAREEVNADRTKSLTERLRANRTRPGSVLNPLELAVSLNEAALADYVPTMKWQAEAPTDKQLDVLAKFGLDILSIQSKGHASLILDRLITRRKLGLATPKQARVMRRFGHQRPETATFEEAKASHGQIPIHRARHGLAAPHAGIPPARRERGHAQCRTLRRDLPVPRRRPPAGGNGSPTARPRAGRRADRGRSTDHHPLGLCPHVSGTARRRSGANAESPVRSTPAAVPGTGPSRALHDGAAGHSGRRFRPSARRVLPAG
jgi:superfamily II DNA or RNA helicase